MLLVLPISDSLLFQVVMCFLEASTTPNFVLHDYNLLGINVIAYPQVKSIVKHCSNASQ
jgi:hypothetical protein